MLYKFLLCWELGVRDRSECAVICLSRLKLGDLSYLDGNDRCIVGSVIVAHF